MKFSENDPQLAEADESIDGSPARSIQCLKIRSLKKPAKFHIRVRTKSVKTQDDAPPAFLSRPASCCLIILAGGIALIDA